MYLCPHERKETITEVCQISSVLALCVGGDELVEHGPGTTAHAVFSDLKNPFFFVRQAFVLATVKGKKRTDHQRGGPFPQGEQDHPQISCLSRVCSDHEKW